MYNRFVLIVVFVPLAIILVALAVVSIVVAIVLSWILWAIVGSIVGRSMMGGPSMTVGDSSFEKGSTGAALEEWAKNMEKAGQQVEASAQQNQGAPSAAAIGALDAHFAHEA